MKHLYIFLILFLGTGTLCGQASHYLANDDVNHLVERYMITRNDNGIHSSIKGYSRKDAVHLAMTLLNEKSNNSPLEIADFNYLINDNNEWSEYIIEQNESFEQGEFKKQYIDSTNTFYRLETEGQKTEIKNLNTSIQTRKPILGIFYKTPANFWELNTENLEIKVNPIVNIKFGSAQDNDNFIFQNTRGIEARGVIDQKIYFHTSLYENQQRFNDYIESRISSTGSIPGNGFYKEFSSSVVDRIQGWDFLNAQGYVGLNISKSVGIEMGHGKHFIGNGHNSLLLDDYGQNYFYLKFNTKVWRLHYQNIFAELSAFGSRDNQGNTLLPKKYMAAHYLDFDVTSKLSIGLFEAVIFNRQDHFEFQYLNPIIIYRTVEGFLDSPDNVLLGLNANYNLLNRFQLYGQIIFDELNLGQFTSSDGWWANKYGIQAGVKYINVLNIDHLDAQVEVNTVRPFTYTHRDTIVGLDDRALASYSHYNQPLAHPLGSNFRELILKLRYKPMAKLTLDARLISTTYGADLDGQNYGGDILRSYNTRLQDYDNSTGQGDKVKIALAGLDVSYSLYHNVYLDLHLLYRKQDSDTEQNTFDTKYAGFGIRMNMSNQKLDY